MKRTALSPAIIGLVTSFCVIPMSFGNSDSPENGFFFRHPGWKISAGLGLIDASDDSLYRGEKKLETRLEVAYDLHYNHKNFYFTLDNLAGPVLGYTLVQEQNRVIDTQLTMLSTGTLSTDNAALKGVDARDASTHLGIRYLSHLADDHLLQLELSHGVAGSRDGYKLSASYGKEWQLKNWIVNGMMGATYLSESMADYYFGVDAHETGAQLSVYSPTAILLLGAGIKAEYPINELWTLQLEANYLLFDDAFRNSPITIDDSAYRVFFVSLQYHF